MKSFPPAHRKEDALLPEVVLQQKIYGATSPSQLERFLSALFAGLKVELSGLTVSEDGRVTIDVAGDDATVAIRFLKKEIGLAPIAAEQIERFSVLQGSVVFHGESKTATFVDVGVFSPRPVYAAVPLRRLQAQLTDGKKFALERITQLFGIVNHFPVEVRVTTVSPEAFTAELTEKQLNLFKGWVDSRLDRLIVLGLLEDVAVEAVKTAGLQRDVLGVEPLQLLEHAIVCKLGTDAVGLVPRLGRRLPEAEFACFSPRRISRFLRGSA
jgi:hypothetical protein